MDTELNFCKEEFLQISRELEKFHAIFYKMWLMGKPNFTNETETAFIRFDKNGDFAYFGINSQFWSELDFNTKLFVICHECLHTILNHGIRIRNCSIQNKDLVNAAEDIVINHLLVTSFSFKRDEVQEWENYYWIDTIFNKKQDIKINQTFEYYFNLLRSNIKNSSLLNKVLVDDHEQMGSNGISTSREMIERLNEELTDFEKETLQSLIEKNYEQGEESNTKMAGKSPGSHWCFANVTHVVKKTKWETVIKKWANKYIKNEFEDIEQWARINRRFSFIANGELIIPSEMEVEDDNRYDGKIEVWFFQDTSGSCYGFRDRFFKAAMSLPEERFDIKMHCFDTRVYETSLVTKKLYGFGGTSFNCIENYIKKDIEKRKVVYPKAVFVITDGASSDYINPQKPEVYYWFLSDNYTHYIPQKSHTYMLKDFE